MAAPASPPLVSVIMPVLDPHPLFFREAVASILGQTFSDFELIIVEDPSPASAAALLATLPDPRIRHQRSPTRTSLVAQRNRGLAAARGEWLALLDADDVSEPHRLATQLAWLRAHPDVDVLGSQLRIIDETGAVIGYRAYPTEHAAIAKAMMQLNPLAQSSLMLRRARVLDAGGYQYERYPCGEDYDLWCRMQKSGARFANHPEALLRYRIQSRQLKLTRLRDHLLCTLDIKRTYWKPQFGIREHARFWAERALLALPPPLVLRLFRLLQYRKTPPENSAR